MDRKRELTSVDIAALVGELGAYEGAGLDKAYLYEDGLVRLKLRHYERGRVELLADVGETKHVRVADHERVPPAPERPPNFAMMLRNRLAGAELAAVEQFEFDRILRLRFERDDDSTTLVIELFGDGNVAVLDGTGTVVDCLETVRLKSRTVAPGSVYEFPDARFNPLGIDFEGFRARFEQSDTDVVRTLATQLNFGGLWAEELCTRAGVEKTLSIAETTDDDYRALHDTVGQLAERLRAGDLDPRLYLTDGAVADVTPVPLAAHADREAETVARFTEALDEYFHRLDSDDDLPEDASRDRPDFEAEIEKQNRIIEQQEGAIEEFERRAEAERETAEALYANYDLVDTVLTTVREARADDVPWDEVAARFEEGRDRGIAAAEAVSAVDGSEGTVTVDLGEHTATLRVEEGVERNADRLYQEAKRIERKRAGAEEAVAETREQLAQIRERRERWDSEDTDETDEADEAEQQAETTVDWLARSSVPVRAGEEWYERFRWFHTSDDFLVIGGRDADDNEALVSKYLDPGDRFLHAQAHGGPVTLLKATGPSEPADPDIEIPERSLTEAARFAVSYSSVWKDGRFAGDAYVVDPDQVSKTPESGEYLEKGGFAIRGERTYFRDVAVGVAVGITCEPETRVIGGPPDPVRDRAETAIEVEPGRFAQNDVAKRLYRAFRERFADESFVRKVASPDLIQEFLPPGGSRTVE